MRKCMGYADKKTLDKESADGKKFNINILLGILAVLVILFAIWGPEVLAGYQDRTTLYQIRTAAVEEEGESYRYSLSSNEKLYILSQCLNNQVLPETELSTMTRTDAEGVDYETLTGNYALVVNYQGPTEKELKEEEVYEVCNKQIQLLKELGVMPGQVLEVSAASYNAVLYSAIDVLDPRNNLSVWKVSLSTSKQNANKKNRLLDVYLDGDTGKIYEFYVRIEEDWSDIEPEEMIQQWGDYLGLTNREAYEPVNPLLETTPYFKKYRFAGIEQNNTVVTIGFYEGINELFLKISR